MTYGAIADEVEGCVGLTMRVRRNGRVINEDLSAAARRMIVEALRTAAELDKLSRLSL